ncbi:2862_t:CDS:2 [Funneliformis mosseae]|uniref:2862_t:CDS:1 n=1 Tax=Funneliformis mosseae TaxID=27381 RepID=A0A9N9E8Z3_FUNMO|nr:2862_t:CDS:2 [Funneliformis mosseae]
MSLNKSNKTSSIKSAYSKKSITPIVSQREIKESTNLSLSVISLSPLEDLIDINDEEPQKSYEKNYSFLVRRMSVTPQKKRKSEISILEVVGKLFFDGNNDDSDDIFEENNKRTFEDDALENSSDDLDEDFQLNFDVPKTKSEKNDFKYAKENFDDAFS